MSLHKLWLYFCSLLIITLFEKSTLSGASKCECGNVFIDDIRSRVAGGVKMDPKSHPFLVVFLFKNLFTCTGSIISPTYILTAAHCIQHPSSTHKYTVGVGVHNRVREIEMAHKKYPVLEIIQHEEFKRLKEGILLNDIALLRIKPLEFNSLVQPICIPGPNFKMPKAAKLAGWGTKREKVPAYPSMTPRQAVLEVLTHDQIAYSPIYTILEATKIPNINSMMVYSYKRNVDACMGDSGAPLYDVEGINATNYQAGIVSMGIDCGNSDGSPGLYTSVKHYADWIREHVKDLCSPPHDLQA